MMRQLVGICAKEGCRGGRVQAWQGRGTDKLGLTCRTRWPGFPAVERQRKHVLRLEFSDTPLGWTSAPTCKDPRYVPSPSKFSRQKWTGMRKNQNKAYLPTPNLSSAVNSACMGVGRLCIPRLQVGS